MLRLLVYLYYQSLIFKPEFFFHNSEYRHRRQRIMKTMKKKHLGILNVVISSIRSSVFQTIPILVRIIHSYFIHTTFYFICLQVSMNKLSLLCSTFLGDINPFHIILFHFTSSHINWCFSFHHLVYSYNKTSDEQTLSPFYLEDGTSIWTTSTCQKHSLSAEQQFLLVEQRVENSTPKYL